MGANIGAFKLAMQLSLRNVNYRLSEHAHELNFWAGSLVFYYPSETGH
jgi:hypothetical protein